MQDLTDFDPEPLLATMARIFASEGGALEVAVLSDAHAEFVFIEVEQIDYEKWERIHNLILTVPSRTYTQIDEIEALEKRLLVKANQLLIPRLRSGIDVLRSVSVTATLDAPDGWRDRAKDWVSGKNVSNQGRVRSDNIASKTCDGLLFRSEPEINLYKALKSRGVSFALLPVFVRGGKTYNRIEPDFVILKDGIVMVVEVDGDTVHQETPADAHARTTMLAHEGAAVERVKASECETEELAKGCADKLITTLAKLKISR